VKKKVLTRYGTTSLRQGAGKNTVFTGLTKELKWLANTMNRLEKMRINLPIRAGRGFEIAPLTNPVVCKDEGAVFYGDFMSSAELRSFHANNPFVDTSKIVDVDVVLGRQPLEQTLESLTPFDYVIASHVFEHVANPVRWLQSLSAVLQPGGLVSLAIPDKRYTFDFLRDLTRISEILANYYENIDFPTAVQALDSNINVVEVDLKAAWDGTIDPRQLRHYYASELAVVAYQRTIAKGQFADVHCTVWTLDHFLRTFKELTKRHLVDLRVHATIAPERYTNEFFVQLTKG